MIDDIGPEEFSDFNPPVRQSLFSFDEDARMVMTLESSLESEYQSIGQTKFYCNTHHSALFVESHIPDLPEFVHILDFSDKVVRWTLDMLPDGSLKSIVSGPQVFDKENGYKHRHEYVSHAVSMVPTDVKLEDVFGPMGDEFDPKTPDFLIETEEFYHFIELTTRAVDNDKVVQDAIEEKIFKYDLPLRNRSVGSKKCVSLSVIVVTPTSVHSTIDLPEEIAEEMVVRLRIALILEDKATSVGLNLKTDMKERFKETIKEEIEQDIFSLQFNNRDSNRSSFFITEDYIKMIKAPSNPSVFEGILLKEAKICREKQGARVIPDGEPSILEFTNLHSDPMRRKDKKPIHSIPWMPLCQEDEFSTDVPVVMTSVRSEKPYLSKLWQFALQERMVNPDFVDEDQGEIIRLACGDSHISINEEDIRSRGKKKYHRVDLSRVLTEEERIDLAKQGVWAKRFDEQEFMVKRQMEQKKSFHWDTDLSDIDAMMEDGSLLDSTSPPIRTFERDLLQAAESLTENSSEGVEELAEWESTKIFRCLDVISSIAFELAVANKQHCKSGTMILKKVRGYKVLLLISPTKSDEHLFYSLLYYGNSDPLHAGVFGKPLRCGRYWMTDFSSIKSGKLENLSTLQGSLLGLASYVSWYHGLTNSKPSTIQSNSLAVRTLLSLVTIRLEDKSVTEQTLSQVRYMYMEIFKSNYSISLPNPFALLGKVPEYQRSRLSLYFLRRIVMTFLSMNTNPPARVLVQSDVSTDDDEEIDPPKDRWENLIDWCSGGIVTSASKVVNLFYYGYLTNKNKPAEGNTDLQILTKTIEEEKNFDKSEPSKSMGECTDSPKGKQFSHEAIRLGAEILQARLKSKFGDNWQQSVKEGILSLLSDRMTEEIATLKASCSEIHKSKMDPSFLSSNVGAKRIFVIEALTQILSRVKLNPMTNLTEFIKFIESTTKVVISDLFKKPQYGGLREIYVLTIESRIIQLFLETLSRFLCSLFPEETLTHPKNKMKILDDHRVACSKKSRAENRVHADYCSSSDKTRWNQNFVMSAMIIPLIKLTPDEFHPAIQRCMNMWTGKLVKIPQRVVNLLLTETPLQSPIYNDLLDDFWKRGDNQLVDQEKGRFLKLESGMMQGILHFTSSLLHLCFLAATSAYIPRMLKVLHPDFDFRMTQACSSDDSATILTVFSPINTTELKIRDVATFIDSSRMLHVIPRLAPYFCMKDSIKSNTANLDYIEYNSEFTFKNTISAAIIKQVGAAFGISESECFNERFHTQYNLMSELFSSGFPAYNTHLVQLSQGYIHYLTMGSRTNPCFPLYSKEIATYPDPALGFFLTDTEFAPGALGFSYSHWLASEKSSILNMSVNQKISECGYVNESGGVTGSIFIRHGEVSRWRRLVSSVAGTMDLERELDKKPELLFRPSTSMSELRVKLAAKVTSPDVAKSLRKGNAFMQALSSSVYALSTHCFTKVTIDTTLGKVSRDIERVSLLSELLSRKDSTTEPPSLNSISVSFPSWERYKVAKTILSRFSGIVPTKRTVFRNRRSVLVVQPMNQMIPLSLQDTCTSKWFNWRVRASGEVARRCWNIYSEKLPWLKDTFESTLQSSPFSTAQQLANLIKSQRFKTRRFSRIGPAMTSRGFRGQLIQLCKKSYKEGHVLLLSKKDKMFVDRSELQTRISLALTLPESDREEKVTQLLSTSPAIFKSPEDTKIAPGREAKLGLIQMFLKNNGMEMQRRIVNTVLDSGSGVVISYLKPQRREEQPDGSVIWTGEGLCLARFSNTMVSIHMVEKEAVKVQTSDWESLRVRPGVLSQIFNELGLRAARESGTQGKPLAKFDGTQFVRPGSLGCPVFLTRDFRATPPDLVRLEFRIKRNSLLLIQKQGSRDFEFIRYTIRPGDISQLATMSQASDPDVAWMNQSPLELKKALLFLKRYDNLPSEKKNWISESLRARLTHRAVGSKYISRQLEDMEVDEPVVMGEPLTDDFVENFLDDLFERSTVQMGSTLRTLNLLVDDVETEMDDNDLDGQLSKLLEEPWKAAVHGLMEYEDPMDRRLNPKDYKDIKYLHPFWDKLIDGPMASTPCFWQRISEGTLPDAERDLAEIVMKVLNIRASKKQRTLLQCLGDDEEEVDFTWSAKERGVKLSDYLPKETGPGTSSCSGSKDTVVTVLQKRQKQLNWADEMDRMDAGPSGESKRIAPTDEDDGKEEELQEERDEDSDEEDDFW